MRPLGVEAVIGGKRILVGGNVLRVKGCKEAVDHDVRVGEGVEDDVAGVTAFRAILAD